MSDPPQNSGDSFHEMSDYLQVFLDETEEQLEDLVETMLVLEGRPGRQEELNEAFRLIHSIKGSAGMMGFDPITALAHHLENCFESIRSGARQLDGSMTSLVLRCVDFLRDCTGRLRGGEPLVGAAELIEELHRWEAQAILDNEPEQRPTGPPGDPNQGTDLQGDFSEPVHPQADQQDPVVSETAASETAASETGATVGTFSRLRVRVVFESGLQLVDLKAQLIVSRLSGLGEIHDCQPPLEALQSVEDLTEFTVFLETEGAVEQLRAAADVDGVRSISVEQVPSQAQSPLAAEAPSEKPLRVELLAEPSQSHQASEKDPTSDAQGAIGLAASTTWGDTTKAPGGPETSRDQPHSGQPETGERLSPTSGKIVERRPSATIAQHGPPQSFSGEEPSKAKVAQTLRVEIDRLDHLMNLAGELVVNRARFVQVSGQLRPEMKKTNVVNRLRDLTETLQQMIDGLNNLPEVESRWLGELESGLELLQEQAEVMEHSRRCFGQMTEAIDQLTRVSDKIQRGVLETRMVPVAPLFTRFKRVVRDLAKERGKKVNLELRGEKTELDKRMIDELGDPLVHLVRNSIDHGLESPEVRSARNKSEVGTILLEATHSGHHVYVRVHDDGGGIDLGRIKNKAIQRGLVSPAAAEDLTEEEVLDYIWHPGFSTAETITDVSGRGVGMDVVKKRIHDLNGTIDVASTPGVGTTFSLRLPLTLAIINSLLVRARDVTFSLPINDVREIVSIPKSQIISVHHCETIDVRGEFIPLAAIDDVFHWHNVPYGQGRPQKQLSHNDAAFNDAGLNDAQKASVGNSVYVVILQTAGRIMGLRVDELLGGQEIVIKSLSENFVSIGGLSGASILGDGSVCLMLDVAAVIDLASQGARNPSHRQETYVGSSR